MRKILRLTTDKIGFEIFIDDNGKYMYFPLSSTRKSREYILPYRMCKLPEDTTEITDEIFTELAFAFKTCEKSKVYTIEVHDELYCTRLDMRSTTPKINITMFGEDTNTVNIDNEINKINSFIDLAMTHTDTTKYIDGLKTLSISQDKYENIKALMDILDSMESNNISPKYPNNLLNKMIKSEKFIGYGHGEIYDNETIKNELKALWYINDTDEIENIYREYLDKENIRYRILVGLMTILLENKYGYSRKFMLSHLKVSSVAVSDNVNSAYEYIKLSNRKVYDQLFREDSEKMIRDFSVGKYIKNKDYFPYQIKDSIGNLHYSLFFTPSSYMSKIERLIPTPTEIVNMYNSVSLFKFYKKEPIHDDIKVKKFSIPAGTSMYNYRVSFRFSKMKDRLFYRVQCEDKENDEYDFTQITVVYELFGCNIGIGATEEKIDGKQITFLMRTSELTDEYLKRLVGSYIGLSKDKVSPTIINILSDNNMELID